MRTRPGKSDSKRTSRQQAQLGRGVLACSAIGAIGERVREPVDERQARVHLDREPAVGRRQEHAAPDAERLRDEPSLALAAAHVLDHRVREDDVELAVRERQRARVTLHVLDRGVASPEARAVVKPESGDPLGPRVVLLEEVHRPAAVALAEAELVGSDVENRRVRVRSQLVEEQLQLPPAGAERDGIGEPHRVEVSGPRGPVG